MIKENAERRDAQLQALAWAEATLRSAIFTLNVGEGIQGCEEPVLRASAQAVKSIARLREALDKLEGMI